jgi:hypothetical protein
MGKQSPSNHGEGHPEAADRFNTGDDHPLQHPSKRQNGLRGHGVAGHLMTAEWRRFRGVRTADQR